MTKAEAIKILTEAGFGINIWNTPIGYCEEDWDEAFDMAIEALECQKEPKTAENGSLDSEMPEIKTDRTTDDCISRQAVIDAIEDHMKAYTSEMDGYNMARRHMKELIEVLRPARPEPLTVMIDHELTKDECDRFKQAMRNAPIQLLPYAQPSDDYNRGWHDGQQALREEIWEDGRDRLD